MRQHAVNNPLTQQHVTKQSNICASLSYFYSNVHGKQLHFIN